MSTLTNSELGRRNNGLLNFRSRFDRNCSCTRITHVGFKIVAPEKTIGFDLAKEYAAAEALHAKRS